MILVIDGRGRDAQLLRRVVAGRPFVEHVAAQLQSLAPVAVQVIEDEGQAPAPDGDALFIDGGAWLSTAALREVLARVEGRPSPALFTDGAGVIARYLPAGVSGDVGRDVERIDARGLDPEQPPVRVADLLGLARVEQAILYERACAALRDGVWIRDPRSVAIRGELRCGEGVEIDRNVVIEGRVTLGDGVRVGANCILIDCGIGARSTVNPFSLVEGATIGAGSFVGPYGRVRPGSEIGDRVQIGNFVEIKASEIGAGSRINHLAFIGDATLADRVTIGAGTITCNHDGTRNQRTDIGAGAYVGSGCLLIAPVEIGADATIAAGSTITDDAPAGKLTVARARQVTVEGWTRPGAKAPDGG